MVEVEEIVNIAVAAIAVYIFLVVMSGLWPIVSDSFGQIFQNIARDLLAVVVIAFLIFLVIRLGNQ